MNKSSSSSDADQPSSVDVMNVIHFDGEETLLILWWSTNVSMRSIDLSGFVKMNKKISSAMNSQLDRRSDLLSMKTCEHSVQPSDDLMKAIAQYSYDFCVDLIADSIAPRRIFNRATLIIAQSFFSS